MQLDSAFQQDLQIKSMEQTQQDSFTLGEIMEQNSANTAVLSGGPDNLLDLPQPPEPEGFFGGMFSRVKGMVQKQDDQDNTNDLDVSNQQSTGSLGESGQMSASQQSSQNMLLAGGMQSKEYVSNMFWKCWDLSFHHQNRYTQTLLFLSSSSAKWSYRQ